MNITSNDEYDVDKRRLRTTLNREIIATFIKIIEFHGVVSWENKPVQIQVENAFVNNSIIIKKYISCKKGMQAIPYT